MKTVLLKISGEFLTITQQKQASSQKGACSTKSHIRHLIDQIKQLQKDHQIAIVIGGGNFFRARKEGKEFGLEQPTADTIGMLATAMNGLILQELFEKNGIATEVLSSLPLPSLFTSINQATIKQALHEKKCIIFCGGTGNPFFTTDTNAVVRALQIQADEVWKATSVDYVYDDDPVINKKCKPLINLTHEYALEKKLKFMDLTAITLSQQHNLTIRFFNGHQENALLKVAHDTKFGSTVSNKKIKEPRDKRGSL